MSFHWPSIPWASVHWGQRQMPNEPMNGQTTKGCPGRLQTDGPLTDRHHPLDHPLKAWTSGLCLLGIRPLGLHHDVGRLCLFVVPLIGENPIFSTMLQMAPISADLLSICEERGEL